MEQFGVRTFYSFQIYGAMARTGGAEAFEKLKTIYEKAELPEVGLQALSALGQTTEMKLLEELYDYAFKEVREEI